MSDVRDAGNRALVTADLHDERAVVDRDATAYGASCSRALHVRLIAVEVVAEQLTQVRLPRPLPRHAKDDAARSVVLANGRAGR